LFTSHGASISSSGSLQLTQWKNGCSVSSDINHLLIERMAQPIIGNHPPGNEKSWTAASIAALRATSTFSRKHELSTQAMKRAVLVIGNNPQPATRNPHEASLQDAVHIQKRKPGTLCRADMKRPVGTKRVFCWTLGFSCRHGCGRAWCLGTSLEAITDFTAKAAMLAAVQRRVQSSS
jgi:hypothetical protein